MTSKLHILSDLHLEFAPFAAPKTDADIVILAGDIYTGTDGLGWARETFPEQEIIYVTGNHEFYHGTYAEILKAFYPEAKEQQIHFLENDECILNGIRFLGCTLWTDYLCYNHLDQVQAMELLGNRLLDHKLIQTDSAGSLFSPLDALKIHQKSLQWLDEKLAEDFPGATIVITHHGPSIECLHKVFGHNELAPGFYSNLESLLTKADYWIYGHTHSNLFKRINKTRLISNQRGYPNENITGFDPGLVIEI